MMTSEQFECFIKIAKKHNVESFSCGELTVNIGQEIPDLREDIETGPVIDDDIPNSTDYLLTNPMMR